MERAKTVIIYALVLLPIALGLKNFLDFSNPLVWGDAPYFYIENLIELFNFPFTWDIRSSNFGSEQLLTLWLYIPTFLQGFFYNFFGIKHEISVRVVFYFSYLFTSFLGTYFLLKKLKLGSISKAFGIIFYILNTYSLLLIDGGQIGVLLSYGLFPLAVLTFVNLTDKSSLKYFISAIVVHFLILNTDLRIALIALFFEFIWWVFLIPQKKVKQVYTFIILWVITLLLSGFWIAPFLHGFLQEGTNQTLDNNQNFIQLINSSYLFQPHFPENDFGNLNKTPIFFIFFPFILLLALLNKRKETLSFWMLLILFVFLAKGENPPFGGIYSFITNLPMGNAFRDSSKFYIPSILTASILIGLSVEYIMEKIHKYKTVWLLGIYIFLLLSVYPVFIGGLSGVLGKDPQRSDFSNIYHLINRDSFFYRTLWFSERPSLGFADWNHPGISANLLHLERPFASMIDGDYDLFGFLHNRYISEWYELLGIKYIFYPPYEREKSLTNKQKAERLQFEYFISKVHGLNRITDIATFPVYSTSSPLPKIFGQEKIIIALGGDGIYERLLQTQNYSLENAGVIFLESAKINPEIIFDLNPKTYVLRLSNDINDLYLSFFPNYFISPNLSVIKEWAIDDSSRYINWKAQLLERGVRNLDYDFGRGFAYSTKVGERLEFSIDVDKTQDFYLPLRYFTASQGSGLKVEFNNEAYILKSKRSDILEWNIMGPFNLKKGNYRILLTNTGGLNAFNTLGLIPKNIFEEKKNKIDALLPQIDKFYPDQELELVTQLNVDFVKLEYKMINPTEYQITYKKNVNWIVFSERFDNDWLLISNSDYGSSVPLYSMLNGYYAADLADKEVLKLYYIKQESVKIGMLISIFTFLLVGFAFIFHIIRRNENFRKRFGDFKN